MATSPLIMKIQPSAILAAMVERSGNAIDAKPAIRKHDAEPEEPAPIFRNLPPHLGDIHDHVTRCSDELAMASSKI